MSTCQTERPAAINRSLRPIVGSQPRAEGAAQPRADQDLPLVMQITRYLVVGGVAFAADFAGLVVFKEYCGLHYLASAAIGFLIGMAINYVLSVAWVFKVRAVENRRLEFLLFALVGVIGLGINQLLLWTLTDGLAIFYVHAKLITTAVVLGWNFAARKLLLFTSPAATTKREIAQL